jgi:hypothetical protein
MTDTAVRTDDSVRDDVQLILDQARDAISEIEHQASEVRDLMIELCGLEIPEDVESPADDLGYETEGLTDTLGDQLERLRKEIAAATDDDTD